jgi:hypothetical protein
MTKYGEFERSKNVAGPIMLLCRLCIILPALLILPAVQPAQATLGETAGSVDSDIKNLSAVRGGETIANSYAVHEYKYDETAVREYVSTSGIVFAIAWNGFTHPDLALLLGPYLGEYEEALRQGAGTGDRSRLEVKTKGVVVQKWGYMRNLQGRVFAPELIPPRVTVDEIR